MYKKIILSLLFIFTLSSCNKDTEEDMIVEKSLEEEVDRELNSDVFKINGDELKFPLLVEDLKALGYVPKYPRYNYAFTEIYTRQLTELSFDRGEGEHITGFVYANKEDGPDKAKIKDIVIKQSDNTTLSIDEIKYGMSKEEVFEMLDQYDNVSNIVDEGSAIKFTINKTIIELSFEDDKVFSIKLTDKNLEDTGF